VERRPPLPWRGVLFFALGLIGLGLALRAPDYRPFGLLLAALSFALGASLFGRPARLSSALQPLRGRVVRVSVWGAPLPNASSALFVVENVTGIGAALYVQLARHDDDDAGGVLKVAQPGGDTLTDECIEIATAKYVEWTRKKVERPDGTSAPALVISLP